MLYEGSLRSYKEASASITATEAFTAPFIWTFQSKIAGMIERLKSAVISIAE
jgi:hypothetical protein